MKVLNKILFVACDLLYVGDCDIIFSVDRSQCLAKNIIQMPFPGSNFFLFNNFIITALGVNDNTINVALNQNCLKEDMKQGFEVGGQEIV